MLALGMLDPAMTRFRRESSRDVSCLTRSVMSFMSWIVPFTRLSRIAFGVEGAADERLRVLVDRARDDEATTGRVVVAEPVGNGGRGGGGDEGGRFGAGGERIGTGVGLTSSMEGAGESVIAPL